MMRTGTHLTVRCVPPIYCIASTRKFTLSLRIGSDRIRGEVSQVQKSANKSRWEGLTRPKSCSSVQRDSIEVLLFGRPPIEFPTGCSGNPIVDEVIGARSLEPR